MRVRSSNDMTAAELIGVIVFGVAGGIGLAYIVAAIVTRIMLAALLGGL